MRVVSGRGSGVRVVSVRESELPHAFTGHLSRCRNDHVRQKPLPLPLAEKAVAVVKNVLEYGDVKTRLQAAKLVLNTTALKDSMRGGEQADKGDLVLEQLGKAFDKAREALGYTDPTRR